MALLNRKRTVLAKIESVYGTDAVPTGANAMLVKNLSINPIQAELVSRDLIRPYFGNSEQLLAQTFVTMDFEVELVGSGVVGKAPAFDALLRACALQKENVTASVAITSSGAVATATKASHGYSVGDVVTISGCDQSEYNGEKTIASVPTANTFTFAVTGSPASPATGTPVIVTGVKYTPVSAGFESVTLDYFVDGVLHKVRGAFGTVEASLAVKQIPALKFSFTGLYTDPSDTAAPTPDFSGFMIPQIANTQNTPGFDLFGYSANLESMSLNLSNEVTYVTLIGSESVKILDRKPAGQLVFEAPTIASKDFFSLVKDSETGAMNIAHGSKSGFKVAIAAPSVLLGNPTYQESNGVVMLSAPFTATPVDGNDELEITFK